MNESNEYEEERRRRMEEHRNVLASLGFMTPSVEEFSVRPKNAIVRYQKSTSNRRKSEQIANSPKRYSCRLKNRCSTDGVIFGSSVIENGSGKSKLPKRENSYGAIDGVEIGDWWLTRMECSHAGIHRPPVNGIHAGLEGAYSVALSGSYEDDVDNGTSFTFTGSGGRDLRGTKNKPKNLRTAPQTKDQTDHGPNLSLITSVTTKNPVRVIRGYKLNSPFAPMEGYRYDGLYTVEKYWTCRGLAGFLVYKFAMKRCEDQGVPPWEREDFVSKITESDNSSEKKPNVEQDNLEEEEEEVKINESPSSDCGALLSCDNFGGLSSHSDSESDKENYDGNSKVETYSNLRKSNNEDNFETNVDIVGKKKSYKRKYRSGGSLEPLTEQNSILINADQSDKSTYKKCKFGEIEFKTDLEFNNKELCNADEQHWNGWDEDDFIQCQVQLDAFSQFASFYEKCLNFYKEDNADFHGFDIPPSSYSPSSKILHMGFLLHDMGNSSKYRTKTSKRKVRFN